MRGQIGLTMLVLRYLELAMCELSVFDITDIRDDVPLVQPNSVLHEQ